MVSEWKSVKLGELVNFKTGKLDSNAAVEGGMYPFFTCAPTTSAIDKYSFNCEAVLLAGNNANGVFSVKYYNGKFDAYQRTYVVTPKDYDCINVRWLFFSIKHVTTRLQQLSVGTATKFLTKKILDSFEIKVPELQQQERIADQLWAMEDKIKLNKKINQTLEQMAQALFKSWFVDFDPVFDNLLDKHDNNLEKAKAYLESKGAEDLCPKLTKRYEQRQQIKDQKPLPQDIRNLFPSDFHHNQDLGWIPEGWEVTNFGLVSECLDRKRIPLSKKQREDKKPGKIPYYGATSIMDYINEWIFDDVYLLIGEDGSVIRDDGTPFVQYIWGKSWVNNHAHVLKGKNGISTEHIMLYMRASNISAYVTGAVQMKLNQKNMNSMLFIKATEKINAYFNNLIEPYYSKYRSLTEENIILEDLRDVLLPKLISGELRLESLDKALGD